MHVHRLYIKLYWKYILHVYSMQKMHRTNSGHNMVKQNLQGVRIKKIKYRDILLYPTK